MLFIEEARQVLKEEGENLAESTVRTYFWNLEKIRNFAPDLTVEEISPEFIRKFREHMRAIGNKDATISKALTVFRNFTQKFRRKGLLSENPFADIKIRRIHSQRGFLTIRELKKLYLSYLDHATVLNESEDDIMRAFLFSCFTGLRFSDLKSLDAKEIIDWKIHKQTHKTGELVYIPIPLQARLLLPQRSLGLLFRIQDNSSFNRHLRSAARKLGCTRYLHCHLARHTFATTCITLGIPLPVTSKLLGHRSLETTLIYAKYIDVLLDREMKKFERLK